MKTYTKEEQRRNLEGACKALEENPKKAKQEMRDSEGGRCCLCVMEDYAKSIDPKIRTGCEEYPHKDLEAFYGLKSYYKSVFNFAFNNSDEASECNDGMGFTKEHTHKEIAARIRKDFLA